MPSKVRERRQVALLVETSRCYGRELLRGIARFAQTRTNWSLLHQEMTIDVLLPEWMTVSKVDGVIARLNSRTIDSIRSLGVPCVDVRCSRTFPGVPRVETEDRLVAKLAFEHLWERGFRRFAFCGFQNAHYSDHRLRAFQEFVSKAGLPLAVYETKGTPDESCTSIEESGMATLEALSDWLARLRPPTGLLVCNDIRGQQVLHACRRLGIEVPDDIGVIGVDDDDAICPLSDPPLSSVRPNAEQIGYRASELLDLMMDGDRVEKDIEFVPPTGVVQRLSTQVIAVEDREVARVCGFIRQHACDGIDVQDVADFTTLSRRQLERRFRSELNRTPYEEIIAVQMEAAKRLLRESDLTLEQIAPLVGYTHRERLSAVFKRECGETPGTYRRRSPSTTSQTAHDGRR